MRWTWSVLLTSAALGFAGCASPGDLGEELYRAGDLRGAVDTWRATDPVAFAPRIAAVDAELAARANAYIVSAREREQEERLAESLLDYRLALELRPDDGETLAHVQVLARDVVAKRSELLDAYRQVRANNDLTAAEKELEQLRRLDPFEPAYETEQLHLQAAIAEEERRVQTAIAEEERQRHEQAREQRSAQVESLVEAGRAAFGDEQLETALDLWRRALEIDPGNARIQAYIARAERQLESLDRLRAQRDSGG